MGRVKQRVKAAPASSTVPASAAVTVVCVWLLGLLRVPVPPEVASAFTSLFASLAAMLSHER